MQLMRRTCEWGHAEPGGMKGMCLASFRDLQQLKPQTASIRPASNCLCSCCVCLEDCGLGCCQPCRTCIGSTSWVHKACLSHMLRKTWTVLWPQCETPFPRLVQVDLLYRCKHTCKHT